MEQKSVQIGSVEVPIILDGGEEWFPVSYITTKVLLRSGKSGLVNKHNKDSITNYLHIYTIKYGDKNIQESRCINKIGLFELLKKTKVGSLSVDQRISQNDLHKYIGLELLPVDEQDTNKYNKKWLSEVDAYTKDIISNELRIENVEWIRRCSKCNNHYPMTNRFFAIDNRADKGFAKVCRVCTGKVNIFTHQDTDKNKMMKQEVDLYKSMANDQIMNIYDAYRNKKINRLPDCYENKESYLRIVKDLYDKETIDKNNLTMDFLINDCNLKGIQKYLSIEDIYVYLFGNNFYLYSYKFPHFKFRNIKLTNEIAFLIINNYIKDFKVIINDVFTFDYSNILKSCGLNGFVNGNVLEFIVNFYDRQYPGYIFKTFSSNYYKDETNLLFDLKYLIEKDMNLEVEKIPLYLTKNVLRNKCNSLYRFIVTKKNGSLFDWVDKLYPGKFIENDFEINAYREEFGSDTERFIHDILKENFKNVIYNQIHTNRTIEINGMIPDWLILTDNGVYVVEYFGLYEERQYGKSSRVTDYIDKTKRKIERYGEMKGYKFLFFYPDDIVDDFRGCREKINKIKENVDI